MQINDDLEGWAKCLAIMLNSIFLLGLALSLALAYAAGRKFSATSVTEHGGPSALSGMLRSLLGSVIGLGIGGVPFLILELAAPAGGDAPFILLAWLVVGPWICLVAIPLVHTLILQSRRPRENAWSIGPILWTGAVASTVGVAMLIAGGTPLEALAASCFVILIFVNWTIYRKLLRPKGV